MICRTLVSESLLYLWLVKNGGTNQEEFAGEFSGGDSPGRNLTGVNSSEQRGLQVGISLATTFKIKIAVSMKYVITKLNEVVIRPSICLRNSCFIERKLTYKTWYYELQTLLIFFNVFVHLVREWAVPNLSNCTFIIKG